MRLSACFSFLPQLSSCQTSSAPLPFAGTTHVCFAESMGMDSSLLPGMFNTMIELQGVRQCSLARLLDLTVRRSKQNTTPALHLLSSS